MESLINLGIIITYLMVGFAALTAVGFGVKKLIANTENAKKTLYTIGGLVIVLLPRDPAVFCVNHIFVSFVHELGVRVIFNVPAAIAAAKAT